MMRYTSLLAAAVVAAAPAPAWADDPIPTNTVRNITADDREEINDLLKDITEEAMEPDFEDVVDYVANKDAERIGEFRELEDNNALNAVVERIQKLWRAKYNTGFDIDREDDLYKSYKVTQLVADAGDLQDTLRASITAPKVGPAPAVTIAINNEKVLTVDRWRIDLVNTMSGKDLAASLLKQMSAMEASAAQWPADVHDAQRMATNYVLAALAGPAAKGNEGVAGDAQARGNAPDAVIIVAPVAGDQNLRDNQQPRGLEGDARMKADAGAKANMAAGAKAPAGINVKDLNEANDIRAGLEKIAESALEDDAFASVTNLLVDADRNRIEKAEDRKDLKFDDLNAQVKALKDAWQKKYGKEFDMKAADVFTDQHASIIQGEISDPAALVKNWPLPAATWGAGDQNRLTTDEPRALTGEKNELKKTGRDIKADAPNTRADAPKGLEGNANDKVAEANKMFGGQANLDKGRNVAIVNLKGSGELPALTLSMIHELPDSWVVDIPDNITATQLRDSLTTHLKMLNAEQAKWPADVNDAYRHVTHHIGMALYNVGHDVARDQ